MLPKDVNGLVNSSDPHQTAYVGASDLELHNLFRVVENLGTHNSTSEFVFVNLI